MRLLTLSTAFAASFWLAQAAAAKNPDFASALYYGTSDAGIVAEAGGVPVPAKRFACANCHGARAEGGREGTNKAPGLLPSALRLKSPHYGRDDFAAALTMGRGLSAAMPRYRLDGAQTNELFAFLEALELRERSGVTPDTVTFGYRMAVPPSLADQRIFAALERQLAVENAQKLHFGRRLRIIAVPPDQVESAPVLAFLAAGPPPPTPLRGGVPWLFGLVSLPYTVDLADNVATATAVDDAAQLKTVIEAMAGRGVRRIFLVGDPQATDLHSEARRLCAALCEEDAAGSPELSEGAAYLLLTADAAAIASAVRRHGRHPAYGLLDHSFPAVLLLNRIGIPVVLADPRPKITAAALAAGESLAEANARTAARLASRLLLLCGRGLTRAKLLAVLRRSSLDTDGVTYDYARFLRSGHDQVQLVTFPADD